MPLWYDRLMEVRNLWTRKWFFYYARVNVYYRNHQYAGTIIKKLDPVSYHLIRWIHGEEELKRMALTTRLKI